MARWGTLGLVVLAALGASLKSRPERPDIGLTIPTEAAGWRAEGKLQSYDQKSIYDYMDGGAEVYLAYGLKALWVRTYAKPSETPITLSLFEMEAPGGAYGAFTFEREDEEAGIGQGSEYGAGMLRFWQGPFFVFVQAERETPAARAAILDLGKTLASRLGPPAPPPALPKALPADGLRPRSVRYVLSPQLLESVERAALGNPLGLPQHCEAVVARYGKPGDPERVLVARFSSAMSAAESVGKFSKGKSVGPGGAFKSENGWSAATATGVFAVLVLDARDGEAAVARLRVACERVKEALP
jgi:hypothetical protein